MKNLHYIGYILLTTLLIFSCKENSNELIDVFYTTNPQSVPEQDVKTLTLGSSAPDFNLRGVDGKYHQLNDYSDAEVLVIIFTCNHCPTAQAYEDRIITIVEDYKEKNVQVIGISPNSINGLLLEELGYSDLGDSFEEMVIRTKKKGYNFPYLYDGDNHEASLLYGPVATPHAFVFDKERKLQYVGRIDKSEKPGTANAEDLRAAIGALLVGEIPKLTQTKVFGCSVKWAWKNEYAIKVNKEWSEKEVVLEDIDLNAIGQLLKNETESLKLINIWATWCGPCVIEYPEFVDIHRMFMGRDFEFASISLDNIENKAKALKFLQNNSSALNNYIYSGSDKYDFIEAIDPDWDGALPYTVLIEPGGKIVFKKMGTIDPYDLKKTIVEHNMIGRYY